ncbi:hypothetical protein GCM10009117_17200 [Gangjinia marincola]|uniref:Peptidase M16 n=1 Tax=Gangjinia marincola TaxID=578463 RepID=A0ABN1MI25_9FLAO
MKLKILVGILIAFVAVGSYAQIDRSQQPKAGPAPEINLGSPEMYELKNGLKVMVVENHKLPRVRVSLVIDNPEHNEGQKQGTKSLLSAMLGKGTTSISKEEFDEEVDFLGANIGFGSESGFASSLSKYFPRVLELMADAAINPLFTEEEFQKEKDKLIEGIKSNQKNVGATASQVAGKLVYGKEDPRGEITTIESAERVTLKDIKTMYGNYFVPKNAYLVVVGDVNPKEVKKLTKKYFKDWEFATPPSAMIPQADDVQYTQVNFIDMPNAVQSELRLVNTVDLKMSDADYFPVLVANQILGGSFGSYLNMNLREEHGYTYGARSSVSTNPRRKSRFTASASVRNEVTDSAVVEALNEIQRIRTEMVKPEDLKRAKSKFAGDFVLRLERPETVANYALNVETNKLPSDFYTNYLKNINAVTAEDVQRVAQKYFKTKNMRIVVAGKGSEVAGGLENMMFNDKKVPVFYFDKEGNKVDKPEFSKPIPAGVTVQTVFENYINAVGGKEAIDKVESVYMIGEGEIQGMKLQLESKGTMTKSMTAVKMNGNVASKQVFDGEKGYMVQMGQTIPYNDEQNMDAKMSANPFPELNVGDAKLEKVVDLDGETVYVVSRGTESSFYNADTGLKVATEKTQEAQGQVIKVMTKYSDYKAVDGVKFPFTISQSFGPQSIDFVISEIKLNKEVSDADFK